MPDEDPFGQWTAAGIEAHELLTSYMEAGFTRPEAFELVRSMLVAFIRNAGPQQQGDT